MNVSTNFRGGGVDSIQNLFNLSNNLVDTLSRGRERILSKREIVRIFLLFDGDVERSIKSLESCFNQTYEFKKIFVVLMNRKNIGDLIIALKDRSDQIEYVDRNDLPKKLESQDGSFIQFVLPGDQLHRDKLMNCVEQMNSTYKAKITLCLIKSSSPPIRPLDDLTLYFRGDMYVNGDIGSNIIKLAFQNHKVINLSRFFFRQKIFNDARSCKEWLDLNLLEPLNLEMVAHVLIMNTIQTYPIYFLREELVESGCHEWNQLDLANYNSFCNSIVIVQI